ncbi:hypothetical protein [Paenibacillus ginsengihumi]|nr:hypothetical protein [Paenibacillus ginsengihumi]
MAYYTSVLRVFGCHLLRSADGKYYYKLSRRSKVRKLSKKEKAASKPAKT